MSRDFWSRRRDRVAAEARAEIEDAAKTPPVRDAASPLLPADDGPADVAARAPAVAAEVLADGGSDPAEAVTEDRSDAEVLEALGLPDPGGLSRGDDFAQFMSRAVPAHLRRQALRRLWRTNPVLANLDRLVDYDEDFGAAARAQSGVASAYQVGRGMTAHVEEVARKAERRLAAAVQQENAPASDATCVPTDAADPAGYPADDAHPDPGVAAAAGPAAPGVDAPRVGDDPPGAWSEGDAEDGQAGPVRRMAEAAPNLGPHPRRMQFASLPPPSPDVPKGHP